MILYKYLSYDAGIKILKTNSIGFRNPIDFNDPFELAATPYSPDYKKNTDFMKKINPLIRKRQWSKKTAVLSLTRQPMNPLMWAHYGENHKGIVIGFNVNLDIFTSMENNIIPVQFGSVIYTATKPKDFAFKDEHIKPGNLSSFEPSRLEQLQRIFLYKSAHWSYEEEVRVVKSTQNPELSKIQTNNEIPLYTAHLEPNCISEIYFGIRSEVLEDLANDKAIQCIQDIKRIHPKVSLFGCRSDDSSWAIHHFNIEEQCKNIS